MKYAKTEVLAPNTKVRLFFIISVKTSKFCVTRPKKNNSVQILLPDKYHALLSGSPPRRGWGRLKIQFLLTTYKKITYYGT